MAVFNRCLHFSPQLHPCPLFPLFPTALCTMPVQEQHPWPVTTFSALCSPSSAHRVPPWAPLTLTPYSPQELLGSLWAYVRLEPADEDEQLLMLSASCPQLLPLLPTAISQLSLLQQAAGHVVVPSPGSGASGGQAAWWHAKASQALAAAGIRPGSLALQLSRHFSVRDLFKWSDRMQVRERGGVTELLSYSARGGVAEWLL